MSLTGPLRVAAIDCGTNSIRLLVADLDPATGRIVADLDRRMEVVRLGQGVDRTGRMAPEAIARTLAATRDYAKVCREAGVQRLRFVATSASRDAENRAEFSDGIAGLLGVPPEVVAGAEEAELSFAGATSALPADKPAPYLVVDLGGGSTEVVLGDVVAGGARVTAAISVDVGCVRLTERHLHADPPTAAELAAAAVDVEAALDAVAAAVPWERTGTLIGLAGTVTTVTAHALRLDRYRPERIDGAELSVAQVLSAATELLELPRPQRAGLGFMHPGRVDVIGAGALIWSRLVARVAAAAGVDRVLTSEHDILDGIAASCLHAGAEPDYGPL